MAGNTRGKLKEHFEGVHRNFDWCLHHVNISLNLLSAQLIASQPDTYKRDDLDEQELALMTYPLYAGIRSLGQGITTLDELSQDVYGAF